MTQSELKHSGQEVPLRNEFFSFIIVMEYLDFTVKEVYYGYIEIFILHSIFKIKITAFLCMYGNLLLGGCNLFWEVLKSPPNSIK